MGGVHFSAACKAFTIHTYFTFVSPLEQKSKRSSSATTTLDISEKINNKKKTPSYLVSVWFPVLPKPQNVSDTQKSKLSQEGLEETHTFSRQHFFSATPF